MGWIRRKDGGLQTTEESGRVTRAGQKETREAKTVKKAGEEGDWIIYDFFS